MIFICCFTVPSPSLWKTTFYLTTPPTYYYIFFLTDPSPQLGRRLIEEWPHMLTIALEIIVIKNAFICGKQIIHFVWRWNPPSHKKSLIDWPAFSLVMLNYFLPYPPYPPCLKNLLLADPFSPPLALGVICEQHLN